MVAVWTTSGIHNQVVGSNRILPSRRGLKAWARESRAGEVSATNEYRGRQHDKAMAQDGKMEILV
jgi:hypothetical protein